MFIRVIDLPYVPLFKWRGSPVTQLLVVASLADTAAKTTIYNVAVKIERQGWVAILPTGMLCKGYLLPKLPEYLHALDDPAVVVLLSKAISVMQISFDVPSADVRLWLPEEAKERELWGKKDFVLW